MRHSTGSCENGCHEEKEEVWYQEEIGCEKRCRRGSRVLAEASLRRGNAVRGNSPPHFHFSMAMAVSRGRRRWRGRTWLGGGAHLTGGVVGGPSISIWPSLWYVCNLGTVYTYSYSVTYNAPSRVPTWLQLISLKIGSKNTAFTPSTLSSAQPSWQMMWHGLQVEVFSLKHRPSHRYPKHEARM